jgi:hypothetical protein
VAAPNPRAKLERAEEHFAQLEALITDFNCPERGATHTFVQETWNTPEGDWEVIRCKEVLRAPPLEWSLIAGDAIHNVRSALDHLASALVLANGSEVSRRTQFPIYDHVPDQREERRMAGNLEGMAAGDIQRIRQMQPYLDLAAERSKRLLDLQRLDNYDKHRVVHPAYGKSDAVRIEVEPRDFEGPPPVHYLQFARVAPGTPLLTWRSDGPIVHVIPDFTFTIGFGDETPEPLTLLQLRRIRDEVREIVESFPKLRPPA